MKKRGDVDFWGLTNKYTDLKNIRYHLQSYFLAFRKNVFLDIKFQDFVSNIKKLNNKSQIINLYEIGLSEFLNSLMLSILIILCKPSHLVFF